jgi:hypothetical protein
MHADFLHRSANRRFFSPLMICLYGYLSFISTFWFLNVEILKFIGIIIVFISAAYVLDSMIIETPTIILTATVAIIAAVGILVKVSQLVDGDKEGLMKSIIDHAERDIRLASSFYQIVAALATAFGY